MNSKFMYARNFHKLLIYIVLFWIYGVQTSFANFEYPELAYQLAKEIELVLIKNGDCKSALECNKERRITMSGTTEKATIYIYKSETLKGKTFLEIVDLCMTTYKKNNQQIEIELNIYRGTIDEKKGWFSKVRPFITMTWYIE